MKYRRFASGIYVSEDHCWVIRRYTYREYVLPEVCGPLITEWRVFEGTGDLRLTLEEACHELACDIPLTTTSTLSKAKEEIRRGLGPLQWQS